MAHTYMFEKEPSNLEQKLRGRITSLVFCGSKGRPAFHGRRKARVFLGESGTSDEPNSGFSAWVHLKAGHEGIRLGNVT